MAFLFGKKRTPPELVKSCLKYLRFVEQGQASEGEAKKVCFSSFYSYFVMFFIILSFYSYFVLIIQRLIVSRKKIFELKKHHW